MKKSVYTGEYAVLVRTLRKTREAAGLTQVQLAKKLRQTQSFVSKCENGDSRLDVVQLRTICRALGTDLPTFVAEFEKELKTKKK